MNDQEMQSWLFERYTNLPEYYREEIADGTFNVRDCCFRMMLEIEEQKNEAADKADKLETLLEANRLEAVVERDKHCHPDHGGHLFSWENDQCPATEQGEVGSD